MIVRRKCIKHKKPSIHWVLEVSGTPGRLFYIIFHEYEMSGVDGTRESLNRKLVSRREALERKIFTINCMKT